MEIEDLPDLALLEVFRFLSNEEKIRRLMLVCKRWYWLLQIDIQELAIYANRPPYKLFWNLFSSKQIDQNLIVRAKDLNEKFAFKFRNLKKLFLFKVTHLNMFFNSLNESSFDQLEELKIIHNGKIKYCSKFELNLPSLRTICIDWSIFHPSFLRAPHLESISLLFPIDLDKFCYPQKIKFIHCKYFKTTLTFRNLEILICESIDMIFQLETMPKLKRVELFPRKPDDLETIKDLKKQKERLERRDLDIWISGFKENFIPAFVDIFKEYVCPFLIKNEPFDPYLDPFDYLNYEEPLCVFPYPVGFYSPQITCKYPNLEKIPENFFRVFINIESLHINFQVQAENLLRFIKKTRGLKRLMISRNKFNKNFFQEISEIQSIQRLSLGNVFSHEAIDVDYDISFIFNLQNIRDLDIETDLKLKIPVTMLIEFLARDLINTLFITGPNQKIRIDRLVRSLILEIAEQNYKFEFSSVDELISHFKKIPKDGALFF